jgi:hypothetical protein
MAKTRWLATFACAFIASGRTEAQLTQPQLAKLVRPSVETKVRWEDENGKVVEQNRTIISEREDYVMAMPSGVNSAEGCQPLDIPWNCQLFIESFRACNPKEAAATPFKEMLAKGDDLVAEELALIAKGPAEVSELKKQLMAREERFNTMFFEAFQQYGKSKGKKAERGVGAAADYFVDFRLVPNSAGAKAAIVLVAYLEAAKAAGLAEKAGVWRDVSPEQPTSLKYGDYVVKASWPDGRKVLKRVRIEKNCQIDLAPEK